MVERTPPHFERHHLEHRRRAFTTKVQKWLRENNGLIVPMHTSNHRLLHLRVKPLDAPSDWLANEMLERLAEYPDRTKHYSKAMMLAGDLEHSSHIEPSLERAEELQKHAWYLFRQLGYVTMSTLDAEQALASRNKDPHEQGQLREVE